MGYASVAIDWVAVDLFVNEPVAMNWSSVDIRAWRGAYWRPSVYRSSASAPNHWTTSTVVITASENHQQIAIQPIDETMTVVDAA